MYNFSIFNTHQVIPSQDIILLGMKMNYFTFDVAQDYVSWKLEHDLPTDDSDFSILDCKDTISVIELLENDDPASDETRRVLRYLILSELISTGETLLQEIESIYADFDYPQDMESFIYYMPCQFGDSEITDGSPVQILEDRFHKFLSQEADYIKNL